MAIDCILAMTAAEIRANSTLPPEIGWLSCHFSPCGAGLSNLPDRLPPGSMLVLDDFVPLQGHDPERITEQLLDAVETHGCSALLLDFQRAREPGITELINAVVSALPCPVGVSEVYAGEDNVPVFLPPTPPDVPVADYLAPWKGREVWLDIAPGGAVITVTANGSVTAPLPRYEIPAGITHKDAQLHCHYAIRMEDEKARFELYRTGEDLEELLEEARALGVNKAIGLWQELRGLCSGGLDDKL